MFNKYSYHSLMRKYVIMFGSLFDDIVIQRYNASGTSIQNIPVPISYAPKEKWVVIRSEDQLKPIAITLPRLSFYCNNIGLDLEGRKTSSLNKIIQPTSLNSEFISSFNQIPYKLDFDLYVIAKNYDDMFQMIEQIIPYFQRTFTPTVKLLDQFDRVWDIPVRMKGMNMQEAYDGDFEKRRVIIYTIQFEIDAWFFGPVTKGGIIKRVRNDFIISPYTHTSERLDVTPGLTEDGQPTNNLDETIPINEINAENDYGFIEEIINYNDGHEPGED